MIELDNNELLARYARDNSEEAFALLVARHVNLVYSAALRHVGNPHQAEEISQVVFLILAKKAGNLSSKIILSSWLCRAARLTAANYLRMEKRRRHREQEAHMQSLSHESEPGVWMQIAPMLDDVMEQLGEKEYNAIVLRFFEGRSFREVGGALGTSEDAAKRRVERAVEKLRGFFTRRGITLSAVTITGVLSANSVQAAPAGLAASITTAGITKGTALSGSTLTLLKGTLKLMAWTKTKTMATACVVVILTAGTATVAIKKLQESWFSQPVDVGSQLSDSSASDQSQTATKEEAVIPPTPEVGDLASILKESDAFRQMKDLTAYIDSLSPEEFPNAIRQVQKSADFSKDQVLTLLVEHWVEIDPKGVMAAMPKTQNSGLRKMLTQSIYGALAAQDPSGAIDQAKQLTSPQERNDALQAIIGKVAQTDPQSALTWLNQLPVGEPQNLAQEELVSNWSDHDPQAAANYVNDLPSNVQKRTLISNVAPKWARVDPQAALTWMGTLPAPQLKNDMMSQNMLQDVITTWAANDPKAILDFMNAQPQDSTIKSNASMQTIIGQWTAIDSQAALAWVNQLPEGKDRDSDFATALASWVGSDPAHAAAYVQSMPDGDARQKNILTVAGKWAANDPNAAAQWAAGLPDGPQKDEANIQIARSWATSNPASAAQWITKLPLPEGEDKNNAYAVISSAWATSDPTQATNWLLQLPSGPSRDAAIKYFSYRVADFYDIGQTYQLLKPLGDPKTVQRALEGWMKNHEPNYAAEMVEKSSLPDDVKAKLLQPKQ